MGQQALAVEGSLQERGSMPARMRTRPACLPPSGPGGGVGGAPVHDVAGVQEGEGEEEGDDHVAAHLGLA